MTALAEDIAPRPRGDLVTVERGNLLCDDAGMPT
jgi:hypothetical protein